MLFVVRCLLSARCRQLFAVSCLLSVVCCLLFADCCLLSVVRCLLSAVVICLPVVCLQQSAAKLSTVSTPGKPRKFFLNGSPWRKFFLIAFMWHLCDVRPPSVFLPSAIRKVPAKVPFTRHLLERSARPSTHLRKVEKACGIGKSSSRRSRGGGASTHLRKVSRKSGKLTHLRKVSRKSGKLTHLRKVEMVRRGRC